MKTILAFLFAVVLISPATGKDSLSKRDLTAFNLWTKAVREDYLFYRSLEDELLLNPRKVGAAQERGALTRNLHQDLEPAPPVSARLIEAGQPFNEVDSCRIAIRRFRAIATTAQRVNSINEKPYPEDAKGYLGAAERCENGMKFPSFSSRFREVMRMQ